MIDHVSIKVKDVEQAKAFYEAALAPLGYARGIEYPGGMQLLVEGEPGDVWVAPLPEGAEAVPTHLAMPLPWMRSTRRRWPPAARTTGRPARAITIRATTRRSCTTPKATTSRPSFTTGPSSRCRRRAVSRCAAPQVASRRSR